MPLVVGPPEDPLFAPVAPVAPVVTDSSTGTWAKSKWAGIADAMLKKFKDMVSPSKGYASHAAYLEARMDFNGVGGLVAGVSGVGTGVGKINPGGINDIVGVQGTACKDTNSWAAGLHGEVRDSVAGGTAIGINSEIANLQPGTRGIGVNAMNWAGNPKAESAFNGMGDFQHGINLEAVTGMEQLLRLSTGSSIAFVYDPQPSVAIIGKLRITIDGGQFYIPVCK